MIRTYLVLLFLRKYLVACQWYANDCLPTVAKELRSKMFRQHPVYYKAEF